MLTCICVCVCKPHVEIVDGFSHVEFIYGVNNDGGSGEEGEQQEKKEVEHHIAHVPANTLHWEIGPVRQKIKNRSNKTVT